MANKEEYSNLTMKLFPVKVISNVEISQGVFLISWSQKVVFIPGQVVKVAIDQLQPTPYLQHLQWKCRGEN